ncbi:E3 ubiquitin-protein ligase TRIM71-like [Mytilus trossulus]|uniref:E3 ubiquitin-protein ligase TRIM71-like n=1 Tax=Mytilus trossulus TaxID=6551 RepID=UPI003007AE73
MASSANDLCKICHDDGISNSAVTWCTECEVFFCENCQKPHSKSRLSKNHKTMSAEDYNKLPAFIQKISIQCKDHNKKFELYCSSHACPCCVQCITDKHQKCRDIKPLPDILKQVKSSASVQIFEKDLNDVKKNYDKAIKYMKTRIHVINIQKTEAVGEIRSMRKSIADYLNKLEQNILDDFEYKHSELKSNMNTLVEQMEQRVSKIDQMQSDFTEMTQYATELQMYVGLREIEKVTSQAVKYIDDLENVDQFSEKNIEVNIATVLQSILQDVKSFGDININTTFSTLQIKSGRTEQAQHLVSKVINDIKPSFLKRLTIPENLRYLDINACLVLKDASDGTTLVTSEEGGQSTAVNLNDKSQTILEGIGADCISLFQERIYCTNYDDSKVCCFKSNGEPLWTFEHQYIASPAGITIDMNGFVYIVSSNDSIVVVSRDGKSCKKILSGADGIKQPWAKDINRETGIMIVSSRISDNSDSSGATYQTAFVYKI